MMMPKLSKVHRRCPKIGVFIDVNDKKVVYIR